MKSGIREELRRGDVEEESKLTPAQRLRRSLEIGRRELRMYMAANQLTEAEALHRLEANKQKARRMAWLRRNR